MLCDRGETLKPTVFHLRRYQIDVVPNCSQGDCISRGLANGQREEQRSRVAAAAAVAAVAAAAVGGGSRQQRQRFVQGTSFTPAAFAFWPTSSGSSSGSPPHLIR